MIAAALPLHGLDEAIRIFEAVVSLQQTIGCGRVSPTAIPGWATYSTDGGAWVAFPAAPMVEGRH